MLKNFKLLFFLISNFFLLLSELNNFCFSFNFFNYNCSFIFFSFDLLFNFCLLNLFFSFKFPLLHLSFFFFFLSRSFNFLGFNFFFNLFSFNGNFSRLISELSSSFNCRSNSSSRKNNSFRRNISNSSYDLLRNMESLHLLWCRWDNLSYNSSFNDLPPWRSNISLSFFRNVLSLLFFN